MEDKNTNLRMETNMTNKNKFTVGLAIVLSLLIAAVYLTACGSDWVVPNSPPPTLEVPPGCWVVEDPVTVIAPPWGSWTFQVPRIECPTPPTDTPPVTPPTDSGTDAGNPSDPPTVDAGSPPEADAGCPNPHGDNDCDDNTPNTCTWVRYNPSNGKCYKVSRGHIDSNGQHNGWVIVSTDEVNCPTIQGQK